MAQVDMLGLCSIFVVLQLLVMIPGLYASKGPPVASEAVWKSALNVAGQKYAVKFGIAEMLMWRVGSLDSYLMVICAQ